MNTIPAPAMPSRHARPRMRFTTGAIGNTLVVLALLGVAVALARLQVDVWQGPVLRAPSLLAAAAVIAAYAGLVALIAHSHRRSAASPVDARPAPGDASDPRWLVVYASQFGDAQSLAGRTADSLRQAGHSVQLTDIADLELATLHATQQALFVASTTGEGDAPDPAAKFVRACMSSADTRLDHLRYGVLALGDSDYQQFCAFGHQLDTWLRSTGAQSLFDMVKVDDGDTGATRHWQYLLGHWGGAVGQADWKAPAYQPWKLDSRRHLNAGSPGRPVFDIRLTPQHFTDLHWQAGDVAEIGPRNALTTVRAWLDALGLPGESLVTRDDRHGRSSLTLSQLAVVSRLPHVSSMSGKTTQEIADQLQPLPHRAYSIASVPAEGCLRLLVRQVEHDDGTLGVGSGWLTAHAEASATVDLRIRRNPAFHAPVDDRPMIMIGNGTGVAGLRALLQERIDAGHHRNWLLFGERSRAHDFHFDDEISAWQCAGYIEQMDIAFSRDQETSRYVQHLVQERAVELRQWLDQGAAVYVCGSLKGMAPDVDSALTAIVGREALETMARDGRYRRDVY